MKRFGRISILTGALVLLLIVLAVPALARTIYGNGTGGIWIDIEASPYSDAWDPQYGNPYGTGGCTWFSEARTEQLTGINCAGIIYGVDQWYNTVCDRFGFPRSDSLSRTQKSLVCWSSPHIAVVEGFTSSGGIIISEGGVNGWGVGWDNGYCRITVIDSEAELRSKNSGFMGYIVLPVQAVGSTVALDVNGYLDGQLSGGVAGYGTFDVYLNGSRGANDVNDYYNNGLSIGTSFEITDIRPTSNHTYDGIYSGSLKGTLSSSGAEVRLKFSSYGELDVKGLLDKEVSEDTDGYGTFDVYINGSLVAAGVCDYNAKWPQGTTYEIKNVQATENKYYNGVSGGSLSGTLGRGTATATLSFSTIVQPGPDWRELDELPGYIDPDTCEIQYNSHYEKRATSSPGAGWTQVAGSSVTNYVNSGGVYESDFELPTSATRVYVGAYYYHYCGANKGVEVEHYQTSEYTDYHVAGDVIYFNVDWEGPDSADARYTAYKISWISGEWAGGAATCVGGRSAVYYRRYQYQDRVAQTTYQWTRDSGWTDAPEANADSVTCRFRLKRYPVAFDANGGEEAPDAQIKYHGIDLELGDVVPIRRGYSFLGWNTAADGSGTLFELGGVYSEDAAATLFAQWMPMTKLVLPAGLKTVESEAFANVGAIIIVVPDGCTSIGRRAFADNDELVQLFIPASVTSIAFDAFENCGSVTIYAPENSDAIKLAKMLQVPYEITN